MSEISVLGGVSPLPATSGLTSGAARTPPSSGERNAFRQALVGLLTAGLAVLAVGGSLLLTLAEGGIPRDTPVAQVTLTETAVPTATQTPLPPSRTPTIGPTTDGQPTAANPPTPSPTATATAAPIMLPTACAPPAGWARVIVQPGDTLFHYAMQSGLSVMALQHANCLPSTTIFAGTRLYVPPYAVPVVTAVPCGPPLDWVLGYTVRPGDNLFRLSLRFGVTLYALQRANCLPSSSYITVGQLLFVPRTALATSTPTPAPTQTATQPPPPPPAPTDTPQPTLTPSPVPPTASPVPPTATPVPPTSTPIPPTPVPPTPTPVPPTATPIPPTPTGSPTPPTATSTPTPTPTASPSPTATATPPSTDAPTPTPSPTATSTDLPPPTPSETPTPTATPT